MSPPPVIHLSDFLDANGDVPDGPGLRLTYHYGTIVALVTGGPDGRIGKIGVDCRRRPGRRPCPGRIAGERDGEAIAWHCPACGDAGLITGWQGTRWDQRPSRPHARGAAADAIEPAGATLRALQLKITLDGVSPAIWRRILLPATFTFWHLHVAIQDAMGWEDRHLHQFTVPDYEGQVEYRIGIPEALYDEAGDTRADWRHRVGDLVSPRNPRFGYLYDFGDGWEHVVELERELPLEAGVRYPVCVAGERACPPEDCGGAPGYADLLAARRERAARGRGVPKRGGRGFDPEAFEPDRVVFSDARKRFETAFGAEMP